MRAYVFLILKYRTTRWTLIASLLEVTSSCLVLRALSRRHFALTPPGFLISRKESDRVMPSYKRKGILWRSPLLWHWPLLMREANILRCHLLHRLLFRSSVPSLPKLLRATLTPARGSPVTRRTAAQLGSLPELGGKQWAGPENCEMPYLTFRSRLVTLLAVRASSSAAFL